MGRLYRLGLQLEAQAMVCCPSSLKDPFAADSTPSSLFHLKFHRCIRAAQWQHVFILALKTSPHQANCLAKLEIGMLGISFHSSWRSPLVLNPFENFFLKLSLGEKFFLKALAFIPSILQGRNAVTPQIDCFVLFVFTLFVTIYLPTVFTGLKHYVKFSLWAFRVPFSSFYEYFYCFAVKTIYTFRFLFSQF